MNPARVQLYDSGGKSLGTVVSAESVNRWFGLSGERTECSLKVRTNDGLFEELQPLGNGGRFLVIDSDDFDTPWVGRLTRVRGTEDSATVDVEGVSLEGILDARPLGLTGTLSGTAGSVFDQVVNLAAASNPTGISRASGNSLAGPGYSADFSDRTAKQALDLIAEQTGFEWWLEHEVTAASIVTRAHFARWRGLDLCSRVVDLTGGRAWVGQWLVDGEAAALALTVVSGQASTTQAYAERPRTTGILSDDSGTGRTATVFGREAVFGHHFREKTLATSALTRVDRVRIAENLKSADGVRTAAGANLERPTRAERVIYATVGPDPTGAEAWWPLLRPGNVVGVEVAGTNLFTGYSGAVRITGVEPFEENGEVDLTVELVTTES